MSYITRHITSELCKVFLVSVLAMTTLMVMVFLVQEALRENLTLMTILELVPYTIPTALSFAIPGTVLFATCIVYGRMSAANEVVAVKSLGVSPITVIWPGVVLAFVLSLITVYLNDLSASWGRQGIYNVVLNSSAKTIYSVLEVQGSFNKGNLTIFVDAIDGQDLINPHIERSGKDGSNSWRVHAAKAQIHVDAENSRLVFAIENGLIETDKYSCFVPQQEFPIEMGDVTKKTNGVESPSNMALRDMGQELQAQQTLISKLRQQMAMAAAFQMVGGHVMGITQPTWKKRVTELDHQVYRQHRLQTEPWRRWANGFSCLCFVLVGAPLAIQMRKSDFWTIFGICFIPILLAYYPLLMYGVKMAKSGELPPYFVWMGNTMMVVFGMWLIQRIERH